MSPSLLLRKVDSKERQPAKDFLLDHPEKGRKVTKRGSKQDSRVKQKLRKENQSEHKFSHVHFRLNL